MKEVYTEIKALTGSSVYFGFGPMNMTNDHTEQGKARDVEELFVQKVQENEIPMILFFNSIDDCMMTKEYFFDTNYHLSTEGATIFTENIIFNMAGFLGY